jgi:hypothetical protein
VRAYTPNICTLDPWRLRPHPRLSQRERSSLALIPALSQTVRK